MSDVVIEPATFEDLDELSGLLGELFSEESWIQVFLGQGLVPRSYDPLVGIKSDPQIEQFLGNIAATIDRCVGVMPAHADYVTQYCPAEPIA